MKKIQIELTPEELASVIHIISEKEKEIQNLTLNKNLTLDLTDKLTVNLNSIQKEETIKVQVKAAISRQTGIPAGQIKDDDHLKTVPLNMTTPQIQSLATPFEFIARQYKPGVTISPDECEEQNTVQNCIELILDKI